MTHFSRLNPRFGSLEITLHQNQSGSVTYHVEFKNDRDPAIKAQLNTEEEDGDWFEIGSHPDLATIPSHSSLIHSDSVIAERKTKIKKALREGLELVNFPDTDNPAKAALQDVLRRHFSQLFGIITNPMNGGKDGIIHQFTLE